LSEEYSAGRQETGGTGNVAVERVTCHWWLAELNTRKADRLPGGPAKESRRHSLAHCDAIRKQFRGSAEVVEQSAFDRRPGTAKRRQTGAGVPTLEFAYEYFREQHDRYETLQSLTLLASLAGTQAS